MFYYFASGDQVIELTSVRQKYLRPFIWYENIPGVFMGVSALMDPVPIK